VVKIRTNSWKCKDIPYYAIRSLTELFGDVVALVNDEILIEDLEDFAALKVCHIVAVFSVVVREVRDDRELNIPAPKNLLRLEAFQSLHL